MKEIQFVEISHGLDVPVLYGLYQDEWSSLSQTFGSYNQLEVVGYNGQTCSKKYYILICNICSQDTELFGQGYFRSNKYNLLHGRIPCGCSHHPSKWSITQYYVRTLRKAAELGYEFIGFYGNWHGILTRLILKCSLHGEWDTTIFSNFFYHNEACTECGRLSTSLLQRISDAEMTELCLKSGKFNQDTKIWRDSDYTRPDNNIYYWNVYCPECDTTNKAIHGNLVRGHRPCLCSPMRQQEAYINLVKSIDGDLLCLKFGVAVDSLRRSKDQNRVSQYLVENYLTFIFPSIKLTREAEKVCKKSFECYFLSKESFPDGYTETTDKSNMERIIEIYKNYGGVEKAP